MAGPYYVRSTDGSDASDGLTWANAKATLAGALAVAAAGERIWVSQDHAETQASAMTLTAAGTAAEPVEILCGNDAAEPPTALATTATVSTTGASIINTIGYMYVYGITFNAGDGASTAGFVLFSTTAAGWQRFENCAFNVVTTNAGGSAVIRIGNPSSTLTSQIIIWEHCTASFANAAQEIAPGGCQFLVIGGSLAATGTVPTALFIPTVGCQAPTRLRGVNLSAINTALVNVAASSASIGFEQCRLHASAVLTTGTPPGQGGPHVWLDNCDSADTQSRMQRHSYEGDVYSETTIVRTGGASDGTTALSHRLVSSANRKFTTPLYGPDLVIWNNTTGSAKTLTVEIVHDSVTALTDAEVWLEVEYLGTSGFPRSLVASDRAADILATPANQTSSSVAWTTTGITNVNKQKLAVTFTPQEIGVVRARVVLAKASYTVYVDPLVTVS